MALQTDTRYLCYKHCHQPFTMSGFVCPCIQTTCLIQYWVHGGTLPHETTTNDLIYITFRKTYTRFIVFCYWHRRIYQYPPRLIDWRWDNHCLDAGETIQGLHSLNGKMPCLQISWSLEATRLDVIMIVSLWNLTGISTALLQRCLSKRLEKCKPEPRGFEISRDHAVRRLTA